MPITHMIYSVARTDHIGGAGAIKATFPNVEIIAQDKTNQIFGERERLAPSSYDFDLFAPVAFSQKGSVLNFSSRKSINTRIFADR